MTDFSCKMRNYLMDIPIDKIGEAEIPLRDDPNDEGLMRLGQNIRKNGLINPVCVRRSETGFALVAGARRLAAARLAGMKEIPCIVMDAARDEALIISLSENLQRKSLNYFEQGRAMIVLMRMTGMTQTEIALRLGLKPASVCNKLRLLSLPPEVQRALIANNFKERQARALLCLKDEQTMMKAIRAAIREKMNVARFEEYVARLEKDKPSVRLRRLKPRGICRDLRIYVNSLSHTVDMMKNSGINTVFEKNENENCIIYRIIVNKTPV